MMQSVTRIGKSLTGIHCEWRFRMVEEALVVAEVEEVTEAIMTEVIEDMVVDTEADMVVSCGGAVTFRCEHARITQ